jgi:hypothetical protein
MISADDYLTTADAAIHRADPHFGDIEKARADIATAQVSALQAIAAAVVRLAEAVEALQDR